MALTRKSFFGGKKLDIGCGKNPAKGYLGLDIKNYGQKYVQDARDGLPGDDWGEIRASHFIEHLTQDEAIAFLNDCWGKCDVLYLIVPHLKGDNAWQLTHKTFYTEGTFKFLEREGITEQYKIKRWTIKRITVNNRNDIHVWLKPKK